jgi:hypothetical protein
MSYSRIVMSETIWLISATSDPYDGATPLAARRKLDSAKHYCDENRKLHEAKDYSVGPITWEAERNGEITGKAVITFIFHGKKDKLTQLYILEEINLED